MKIVVVAHHSRIGQANRLAFAYDAHLIVDDDDRGALAGHREALEWCATRDERCIIMEDDALPVLNFERKALAWLDRHPNDLLSFYLGTGRPPQFQREIGEGIASADAAGRDCIALPQLIHGVCYSVPQGRVVDVLGQLAGTQADFAIGNAWRRIGGGPVIYPVASLVEHEDGESVEKHADGQPRKERRKAWRLDNGESPVSC